MLRTYRPSDAAAIRAVFERAVRITAAGDYTRAQREAWAPANASAAELEAWGRARAGADTIVATGKGAGGGALVGFAGLVDGTLLDMLYVDPDAGRRGIGSALIERLVSIARDDSPAATVETYASLTARPLFERHGFVVVEQRTPVVRGVAMTNFRMRRELNG